MSTLDERYLELSGRQSIAKMARYAFEWSVLGEDMDKAGRPATADECLSRGKHYGVMAGGEYVRLIDMPFSEVIKT